MNSGNEVETETEAFTPTAVTLAEDAEDFESADDLFNAKAQASQRAVGSFLLAGERVMLGGFGRQAGVRVQLVEPRVAEVGKHDGVGVNVEGARLE